MRCLISLSALAYVLLAVQPVRAGPLNWAGRARNASLAGVLGARAEENDGVQDPATTPEPEIQQLSTDGNFPSSLVSGFDDHVDTTGTLGSLTFIDQDPTSSVDTEPIESTTTPVSSPVDSQDPNLTLTFSPPTLPVSPTSIEATPPVSPPSQTEDISPTDVSPTTTPPSTAVTPTSIESSPTPGTPESSPSTPESSEDPQTSVTATPPTTPTSGTPGTATPSSDGVERSSATTVTTTPPKSPDAPSTFTSTPPTSPGSSSASESPTSGTPPVDAPVYSSNTGGFTPPPAVTPTVRPTSIQTSPTQSTPTPTPSTILTTPPSSSLATPPSTPEAPVSPPSDTTPSAPKDTPIADPTSALSSPGVDTSISGDPTSGGLTLTTSIITPPVNKPTAGPPAESPTPTLPGDNPVEEPGTRETSEPTSPTSTRSPEPTPPADPSSTVSEPPPVFTSALDFAEKLNKEWSVLSPGDACSNNNEDSCIDGQPFLCLDGVWQTKGEKCPEGSKCVAVPADAQRVRVACQPTDKIGELLGKGDGQEETPPEQPDGGDGEGDGRGGDLPTTQVESSLPEPTLEPTPKTTLEPVPGAPSPTLSDDPDLVTTTTKTSTTFITKIATRPPPAQPEPSNTVIESIISSSADPVPKASSEPSLDASPKEDTLSSPDSPLPSPSPPAPPKEDPSPTAEPTYNDKWGGVLPPHLSFNDDSELTTFPPQPSEPPSNKEQGDSANGSEDLPEPSLTVTEGIPTPSSEAKASQGNKEDADFATTIFAGGTPTVEYYFTVTETEKETATVTETFIMQGPI